MFPSIRHQSQAPGHHHWKPASAFTGGHRRLSAVFLVFLAMRVCGQRTQLLRTDAGGAPDARGPGESLRSVMSSMGVESLHGVQADRSHGD